MKTKIPILLAASLLLVAVTKAQYAAPCPDNRVVIQGQVFLPGQAYIAVNYNGGRDRYDDNHYRREEDHGRYDDHRNRRNDGYGRYDDRRDWREVEYERYCRETRGCRMSREEFYRSRCDYRMKPGYQPRVVVYHY